MCRSVRIANALMASPSVTGGLACVATMGWRSPTDLSASEEAAVPVDTGQIIVGRPERAWRDRFRQYLVKIDGVPRGKVRQGGSLVLPVAAGRHTVEARIDFAGSPLVDLDMTNGETLRFSVQPCGNAWQFYQAFAHGRHRYLLLRRD
jgi:hypothetical protein